MMTAKDIIAMMIDDGNFPDRYEHADGIIRELARYGFYISGGEEVQCRGRSRRPAADSEQV